MFEPGDRVRWETVGDDGFPIVRYGFVGGCNGAGTRVAVMLDDQLNGTTVVECDQLERVTVANLELRLGGADLLDDPALRQGLVSLWSAEADQAGLQIRAVSLLGTGVRDHAGFVLAEISAGGEHYILRAEPDASTDTTCVCVQPDP